MLIQVGIHLQIVQVMSLGLWAWGANYTDRVGILKMLEVRYLDDWLYQANIRQAVDK